VSPKAIEDRYQQGGISENPKTFCGKSSLQPENAVAEAKVQAINATGSHAINYLGSGMAVAEHHHREEITIDETFLYCLSLAYVSA